MSFAMSYHQLIYAYCQMAAFIRANQGHTKTSSSLGDAYDLFNERFSGEGHPMGGRSQRCWTHLESAAQDGAQSLRADDERPGLAANLLRSSRYRIDSSFGLA